MHPRTDESFDRAPFSVGLRVRFLEHEELGQSNGWVTCRMHPSSDWWAAEHVVQDMVHAVMMVTKGIRPWRRRRPPECHDGDGWAMRATRLPGRHDGTGRPRWWRCPFRAIRHWVSGHEGDGDPLSAMMVMAGPWGQQDSLGAMMVPAGHDGEGAPSGLYDTGSPAMMAMVTSCAPWSDGRPRIREREIVTTVYQLLGIDFALHKLQSGQKLVILGIVYDLKLEPERREKLLKNLDAVLSVL